MPKITRLLTSVAAAAAALILAGRGAGAATITVNGIADTVADDGVCTLREAIIAANTNAASGAMAGECAAGEASPTVDTIAFAIPGVGVHTISPLIKLPDITESVIIDGYTQAGSSPNINPPTQGLNTVLTIELSGALAPPSSNFDGLIINAPNCIVRGLVINSFQHDGIGVCTDGNVIEGNFIGTNPAGTAALPNGAGGNGAIVFGFCGTPSNCTVGGTTPDARNLISGNIGSGIGLGNGSGNTVQGNLIGTDVTGTLALGNSGVGVGSGGSNDLIGGTTVAARNIISANNRGIDLGSGSNNTVQGNFIGTDIAGTIALSNPNVGVNTQGTNDLIGGLTATPGAPPGNLISGNYGGSGVILFSPSAQGHLVEGNIIGADITGTQPLGNFPGGIQINGPGSTVGGTDANARNMIAFNGGSTPVCIASSAGIWVHNAPAINNAILGNSIFSNAGLGIDLEYDGDPNCVEPNDHCDADAGPNNLQNYPVVSASFSAGNVMISGTLDSVASTMFRLEFFSSPACHSSGFGQGDHFLGSTVVTTAASCTVAFGPLSFPLPTGDGVVAATAARLDSGGNPVETSEFSACFASPATTTSTSTVVPTTSTTASVTTSSVTTTSMLQGTTSSTSTSTTHTTVLATTTTLAPACGDVPDGPTFASIICRIELLIDQINAEPALAKLQSQLVHTLMIAESRATGARDLCAASNAKKSKKRLAQTKHTLGQYVHRLGSKPAHKLDDTLRRTFIGRAQAIESDVQSLHGALRCPADANQ